MIEIIKRELIYLLYYCNIQFEQIALYWVVGILLGSAISVFFKEKLHSFFIAISNKNLGIAGLVFASALGIASPLCMYGTIPVASSFSKSGAKDDMLASFIMSSILLNPQLIIYSFALGIVPLIVRVISCFVCGIVAGVIIKLFYAEKQFFTFSHFEEIQNKDINENLFIRYVQNVWRNIKATAIYFIVGILLSAIFQRYVPESVITKFFAGNKAWGVLMAATIGVPLYACGGGTIPLLQQWLWDGMSVGSATSFMITGPATKITNIGALKIILGTKHFLLYISYVIVFSIVSGFIVNIIV